LHSGVIGRTTSHHGGDLRLYLLPGICYPERPYPATEMMITLYGIKNCDTVKKARKWLEQQHIEYQYHDLREDGLDAATVGEWLDELGWETLVNKRSTSWKALAPEARETMDDEAALAAILSQPTLIKRPLLDTGHQRFCGFAAADYRNILGHHTL
jgi:Spx/MgsR family transcriptional regulator